MFSLKNLIHIVLLSFVNEPMEKVYMRNMKLKSDI